MAVLLINCARRGSPTGGPKDETAPVMVTAKPPYETTHFKKENIKLYFDEYVVLKDLQKQLIVSPPLKNPAVITPQGVPSKYINIKLVDTLKKNTTYIFNFGSAVQDNNENNKLESFKYVFSTGSYIDSLTLKGTVVNAFSNEKLKQVNVALYKIDTIFNDSIIYKQKPNYVTSTLDSTNFKFTNIKQGKYLAIALKEESNDYIFNAINDKIAFVLDTISLPKDSVIAMPLHLFKETQPFKFKRGKEVSKGKIQFGFTGAKKDFSVKLISEVPSEFLSITHFEKEKDTLNYWFTPVKKDSLNFIVSQQKFIDTVTVKLRKKKMDTLVLKSSINSSLHPKDTFFINSNNPIVKIDVSKISITDKDTIAVSFKKIISKKENKIGLLFPHKFEQNYTVKILPNAFVDLYNQKNDSLQVDLRTQKLVDYGEIELKIENKKNKNLIVELITDKKVIQTKFLNTSKSLNFTFLNPKKYTIRVIVDKNNDKKWTTGSFLRRIYPEKVIYLPNEIELRANWTVNETIFVE